jgi:hypothetical protein
MSCAHFESLIALNMTGDLSVREAAQVRAHLEQCAACRTLAQDLVSDLQWLQSAHREPADRAALHQVRVHVMQQLQSERWNRPFGGLAVLGWRWQWVAVSAAVITMLGAAGWWVKSSRAPESNMAAVASRERQQPSETDSPGELAHSAVPSLVEPAAVSPEPALKPQRRRIADPDRRSTTEATRPGHSAHTPAGRVDELVAEEKIEVVTAIVSDAQEETTETMMLKMPTSNPDVIVYWVVDDEAPLAGDSKGD